MRLTNTGLANYVMGADAFNERKQERDDANKKYFIEMGLKYGNRGIGSGSRIGSSGEGGTSAEKIALLASIQDRLPDDSNLAPQLVGASIQSLKEFEGVLNAGEAHASSTGATWTPQMAEESVEYFKREVIENKSPFDAKELAEMYGIDDTSKIVYGTTTYADIIQGIVSSSRDVGIAFSPKPLVEPIKVPEQTAFRAQYQSSLQDMLADKKAEVDSRIAASTQTDKDTLFVSSYDQAVKDLNNKSFAGAIKLVGPEAAIQTIQRNPQFKQYRSLINKNLIFSANPVGEGMFEESIRSGLLDVGDTYTLGNRRGTVTQAQKDTVLGL
tara:strand:- start:3511 stop:4491 length:981 start_codon:yes stop_codon:yes gene_type:complete